MKPGARSFFQASMGAQGPKHLSQPLLLFQGHQQGSGWKVEQPRPKSAPILAPQVAALPAMPWCHHPCPFFCFYPQYTPEQVRPQDWLLRGQSSHMEGWWGMYKQEVCVSRELEWGPCVCTLPTNHLEMLLARQPVWVREGVDSHGAPWLLEWARELCVLFGFKGVAQSPRLPALPEVPILWFPTGPLMMTSVASTH